MFICRLIYLNLSFAQSVDRLLKVISSFRMILLNLVRQLRTVVNSSNSYIFKTNSIEGFRRRYHRNWFTHTRNMNDSTFKVEDSMVWLDLELTGLDVEKDHILEIACLITDGNLNIIAEGPSLVIHQPSDVLSKMGDWCTRTHKESGLTDDVLQSKISLLEAEMKVFAFIRDHVPPGKCPLAGNTVYMDRLFLKKFMPRVDEHLHYRLVDVSAVKELCRRWYPTHYEKILKTKQLPHRALADIKNSIKELDYYRSTIFKKTRN